MNGTQDDALPFHFQCQGIAGAQTKLVAKRLWDDHTTGFIQRNGCTHASRLARTGTTSKTLPTAGGRSQTGHMAYPRHVPA